MPYPTVPDFNRYVNHLCEYAQLQAEYGAKGIEPILADAEKSLAKALQRIRTLPIDKKLAAADTNDLKSIQALRPAGPRKMWVEFDRGAYQDRLQGALLGRFGGCTLGAPVEFWSVQAMQDWAQEIGDAFPPTDYWSRVPNPHHLRYSYPRPLA